MKLDFVLRLVLRVILHLRFFVKLTVGVSPLRLGHGVVCLKKTPSAGRSVLGHNITFCAFVLWVSTVKGAHDKCTF